MIKTCCIRPATPADKATLIAIEKTCFQTDLLTDRQMRYMLKQAKALCLVAEVNHTIAAYAICLTPALPRPARLYSLAVLPTHRGQGLGDQLMQAIRDALQKQHYTRWRLEVEENNLPAIRLYSNHGFNTISTVPNYYENGSNAIRMQYDLPQN